jgi:hypothetical protein
LGDGSWYYNFNIKEIPEVKSSMQEESGEGETAFEYETVLIWGKPEYETLVPLIIAGQYSASKELSLINKYNAYALGISGNEQDETDYRAYIRHTFEIKATVKNDLQEFNS